MRLLPDSIAGRAILALALALLLSHAVALALFTINRADSLTALGEHLAGERIASVVRLMEDTLPEERPRTLKRLAMPGLRMAWSPEPLVTQSPQGWAADLAQGMSRRLDGTELRVARGHGEPPSWAASPMSHDMHEVLHPPFGRSLLISVKLDDGSWLNFAAAAPPPPDGRGGLWHPRFILPFTLMTLAVGLITAGAVRRTTRPLAVFAAAAERLGMDVTAPPVSERGPREVRRAAHAFNEMQTRLRRFIDDRTQMLAAISHDLRTPITRLKLRAEFIDDDEQRAKMLADLDEMEQMIAATLSFARDDVTREQRKAVDVAALLQGLCDDFGALYAGPERLVTEARPTGLKRAFANLIDNAVKYGIDPEVRLVEQPDVLRITVADHGPGIPEAEHERVFAPFYRLESSRNRETGGTGLGLAVARSAIRAHGGDIALSATAPGGGLTVEVTLPRGG